jgi:hypothetical protein
MISIILSSQSQDVRVIQMLHQRDFGVDESLLVFVFQHDRLTRAHNTSPLVLDRHDFTERTLSLFLEEFVVVEDLQFPFVHRRDDFRGDVDLGWKVGIMLYDSVKSVGTPLSILNDSLCMFCVYFALSIEELFFNNYLMSPPTCSMTHIEESLSSPTCSMTPRIDFCVCLEVIFQSPTCSITPRIDFCVCLELRC